jgi:hypothetical protein
VSQGGLCLWGASLPNLTFGSNVNRLPPRQRPASDQ